MRSTAPRRLPWILGLGAVLALPALALLLPRGEDPDVRRAVLEAREAAARRLERDGRLEDAATALETLAREAAADEAFRVRAQEWRAQARTLRAEAQARRGLEARWKALDARAKGASDLASLMSARQALAELRTAVSHAPWLAALDARLGEVDGRIAALKVPGWQETKAVIEAACALAKPGEARWDEARRLWKEYLGRTLPAADREGAERHVKVLEAAARGEADRILKRADALAEAGRADEAKSLIDKERPRFGRLDWPRRHEDAKGKNP